MVITMEYHNEAHETERAWIEVNLQNLRHNAAVLQKAMPQGCELMAVVKCRAYGHGDLLVPKELEQAGVKAFAVATIEEGIRLRENGIRGEILILGYTDVRRAADLVRYDLMQSIIDYEYAQTLNEQGILAGVAVKTHVKIDTGMHRLGIPADALCEVREVFAMKAIKVCGIYTHLCCADSRKPENIAYTKEQIALFYRLLDALKKEGILLPKQHIQSSYGLLNYPDLKCDYVRTGIALYGVLSSADDDTVLMLIRHQLVPVIGRICMDQLIVDVTDAVDIMPGDIATLIGAEGCPELSAPYVAQNAGRISNELLCRMGTRLPVSGFI